MLCVPQSEAVATALLVPMSNTQEAKPKESRAELSLENETKIKTQKLWPPRKVSSDFRWRLLGRQQAVGSGQRAPGAGCSSGGYSSNEALSKFGRSCR